MKISLDTNVLLRLIVGDDVAQRDKAVETLERAELVAVSVHALCEFVWVLERHYGVRRPDVAAAIRRILDMRNVVANRPAVEAGLAVLDAGGDFADGVIAFDGRWLGGETFVSFDRKAVALMERHGIAARLPP
ncbi:type II toxin-antitoxin system VapC family toxin [Methylobacterium sp. J-072]|uniref:type II toxin-antitoxin system VapC family toxin n=1 Tax=Methylobacterium sp. J-072 TaxID=2836651 RepID=UPI001FBAF7FA|nr:type II toxin-antitoxin system VapC family toxin [Methylobacterium sp. J-072]MCJ2094772.1 type II toxin-antitoxin system VapC family toxin [Methylobacterium sp. J-072]